VRARRYNVTTGARNTLLRSILKFVDTCDEGASRADLEDEFDISRGAARTAVVDLMDYGLLGVLREEQIGGSLTHYYCVLDAADDKDLLDSLIPTSVETAIKYGYTITKELKAGNLKEKDMQVNIVIRRDPFDLLLMGPGEAPSLAYHRSSNA
jgi:hypothetical protein